MVNVVGLQPCTRNDRNKQGIVRITQGLVEPRNVRDNEITNVFIAVTI